MGDQTRMGGAGCAGIGQARCQIVSFLFFHLSLPLLYHSISHKVTHPSFLLIYSVLSTFTLRSSSLSLGSLQQALDLVDVT